MRVQQKGAVSATSSSGPRGRRRTRTLKNVWCGQPRDQRHFVAPRTEWLHWWRCEAEGQIDRRRGHPVRQGPGTHWCSRMRGRLGPKPWAARRAGLPPGRSEPAALEEQLLERATERPRRLELGAGTARTGAETTGARGLRERSSVRSQDHLAYAISLQIAREAGPTTTAERAELAADPPGGEAKKLAHQLVTFGVDGPQGLKDESREKVGLTPKSSTVLLVLGGGVLLTRASQGNGRGAQRARDGDVDGHASLPSAHSGIVTSPGRRPEVGPRMPCFSKTGLRRASLAMRCTKFLTAL